MFKVIVWATDGSSAAAQALPYVKSLAQTDRSRIVVVHVDEFGVGRGGLYSLYVDEAEVQAAIRRQVADLKREGFDVKLRTARMMGGAAPMIAEIAKDEGAHLIVVGTRGLGSYFRTAAGQRHPSFGSELTLPVAGRPYDTSANLSILLGLACRPRCGSSGYAAWSPSPSYSLMRTDSPSI
jgi:nucleotide-binding universal stress UspA family protein